VFFLIANGTSLFGILLTRPARRLGNISYGIYLLHPLLMTSALQIGSVRALALSSAWTYWSIVAVIGTVLVLTATALHALVERPGVELGRLVQKRVRELVGAVRSHPTSDAASAPQREAAAENLHAPTLELAGSPSTAEDEAQISRFQTVVR
jgi:peptidoglycan/LPS O-acetylase OafA/YrhL